MSESAPLTHFNTAGHAHMTDISAKAETARLARAAGRILMQPATLERIREGSATKGDVLGVARIAGITGAKRAADLIPLCHPLALTHIDIDFRLDDAASAIECQVRAENIGRTGVEMEALAGVTAALLTIYDMCKAIDRGMTMSDVRLLEKTGGKSGPWRRAD